jgi:hypothetical protein
MDRLPDTMFEHRIQQRAYETHQTKANGSSLEECPHCRKIRHLPTSRSEVSSGVGRALMCSDFPLAFDRIQLAGVMEKEFKNSKGKGVKYASGRLIRGRAESVGPATRYLKHES